MALLKAPAAQKDGNMYYRDDTKMAALVWLGSKSDTQNH